MELENWKKYWDVAYNWGKNKIVMLLMITIFILLFIAIRSSSSLIFIKPSPGQHVKIEMYDNCLSDTISYEDSLAMEQVLYDSKINPKEIKYLVFHCTATIEKMSWSKDKWLDFFYNEKYPKKGMVGYHKIITKKETYILRKTNEDRYLQSNEIVWGVAGYNSVTINIAIEGGLDNKGKNKDTRNQYQKDEINREIEYWKKINPNIQVALHNQFNKGKTCPNFKI